MTRINLVSVEDLADQHLFAEWREIKMPPAALRRSLKTRKKDDILRGIPSRYTLNTGHVTFFFDKMNFLADRYKLLTEELVNRQYGIAVHDVRSIFYSDIPPEFTNKRWEPINSEIAINVARINLRISEKPTWYRYYGKLVDPVYFSELYKSRLTQS